MKKVGFALGIIVIVFISCNSREEKANELIKGELFKRLHDFSSYEPIETIVDSAFTSIYNDSNILVYAYMLIAYMDLADEHANETKTALSSMELWSGSRSTYGKGRYYEAKEKYEENLEKAELYWKLMQETIPLIKEEILFFEPSFCGFEAKHKFRSKTKGGNFTIANYSFIMDSKFKNILSVKDLEDENDIRIREIIDEAKEYQFK